MLQFKPSKIVTIQTISVSAVINTSYSVRLSQKHEFNASEIV